MGGWGDIFNEVTASAKARGSAGPDLDGIRLRYLQQLNALTGRVVIAYGTAWLHGAGPEAAYSVDGRDVHALMEVCHRVEGRELDLILHSPGGSPEAAEQVLNYLRTQFDHIRCFVPLQAKSAATMIALGCDEIFMGLHSELGPIDPQLVVPFADGRRLAPAHAILRDFERAQGELAERTALLVAWTPILRTYAGGLIEVCRQAVEMSQDVVAGWLETHMLAHPDAGIPPGKRAKRAREIAEYFGSKDSYDRFRTHGRPIRIEELRAQKGLVVRALEDDDDLQDAVLSYYHALDFTLNGPAAKVVENHLGRRLVRLVQFVATPVAAQPAPSPSEQHADGQLPQPRQNRAQRRHPARKAASQQQR